MFKKTLSLLLCIVSLFTVCALAQAEGEQDFLNQISGRYVELFPEMSKAEYREIWLEATGSIVGEENAEATTDQLIAHCTAEIYGEEATALYAEDPSSTRFDCYFIGGVREFVMDGNVITGLDENGEELFSHTYAPYEMENENGFLFYKTEDEDAGQFTYFAFSPDTMETTYHLEFRYAEDIADLQSWFEGRYAYWNVGAIAADYTEQTMQDVIYLFATENLSE